MRMACTGGSLSWRFADGEQETRTSHSAILSGVNEGILNDLFVRYVKWRGFLAIDVRECFKFRIFVQIHICANIIGNLEIFHQIKYHALDILHDFALSDFS